MNTAPDGKIHHLKNQWYISEILEGAGTNIDDVNERGAIVLMKATFDCDFNTQSDTDCDPTWEYSRLDKTERVNP